MKKEYLILTAFAFFVLAYVLDYFAGPIFFAITNPLTFLTATYLKNYPLTAFAIGIRSLGIFISIMLLFSLIEKQHFVKAFSLFIIGVLSELYSIQQITTGMRTTTIQWTLSISYSGMLLITAIIYYLVLGIIFKVKEKFKDEYDVDKEKSSATEN